MNAEDKCRTGAGDMVLVTGGSVYRFRECLDAESERQVRRANEAFEKWKCKRSKECQKR